MDFAGNITKRHWQRLEESRGLSKGREKSPLPLSLSLSLGCQPLQAQAGHEPRRRVMPLRETCKTKWDFSRVMIRELWLMRSSVTLLRAFSQADLSNLIAARKSCKCAGKETMSRSFYRIVNNTVDSSKNHRLELHTQAQPTREPGK